MKKCICALLLALLLLGAGLSSAAIAETGEGGSLAAYNGKRGKWRLKYLFYIYYPAHLAVIWGIASLL